MRKKLKKRGKKIQYLKKTEKRSFTGGFTKTENML